jgi:multiple sugar transport system ATP-binding protein
LGDHEMTARVDPSARPSPGDVVEFGFDEAALYLFDPATGETRKSKTDGGGPPGSAGPDPDADAGSGGGEEEGEVEVAE